MSAGEAHADIDLGNGCILHSVGKLSLDEYSQILLDSYAGISLMVSPHPSYPPLEMSTFGVNTITNCYGQKDLATFNDNIFSLKSCSPHQLAEALVQICSKYNGQGVIVRNTAYTEDTSPFTHIAFEIKNSISEILN